ncbi:MAG: putative C-S lyase [Rikenellaceae bacterium]|nr:putative C-S lyase [Rikenellaceae bacterium]
MMKSYNFDKITERRGTNAIKTDGMKEAFGRADLVPLWIADMDFDTPDFVVDALRERLEHPVLGYTALPEGYWECVGEWIFSHHQWHTESEWFCFIPGIVKGIGMVINALLGPNDKIIIQPPVYPPFRNLTEKNGHQVVCNPLKMAADGSYEMDFDNLERVVDSQCKLLILSNPHNPAGIVWGRSTLARLAEFCHAKGITVISDEIHCDMALWGNKHTPFASISDKAAECSITFGAPSKTFNIAGIVSSYAIIPNPTLRERVYGWIEANELALPNILSPIATMAAFREGEEWRQQMLRYVEGNVEFVEEYCREHIPQIRPLRPGASFLVWLDCRGLGMSHEGLVDFFINKAHLALNSGASFGREGEGFMRLNVGTARSVIAGAMEQLRAAIEDYNNQ